MFTLKVKLLLLSVLCKEHVLLLGPPGTGSTHTLSPYPFPSSILFLSDFDSLLICNENISQIVYQASFRSHHFLFIPNLIFLILLPPLIPLHALHHHCLFLSTVHSYSSASLSLPFTPSSSLPFHPNPLPTNPSPPSPNIPFPSLTPYLRQE